MYNDYINPYIIAKPTKGIVAMKDKKTSIHRVLLSNYLLTMLVVLALITLLFSIWQLSTLKKNVVSSLQQTCSTVVLNVDKEIQRMDTISINILYSNLIKETFASYSAPEEPTPQEEPALAESARARNTNAEQLTNLLTAIMGADRPVRQVNLYNKEQGCFGTGMFNGALNQNAPDQLWYTQTIEAGGLKYIPLPSQDPELSRREGASPDQYYFPSAVSSIIPTTNPKALWKFCSITMLYSPQPSIQKVCTTPASLSTTKMDR